MRAVRLLLFAGLALHKLVWELMKGDGETKRAGPTPRVGTVRRLLKLTKIGVLATLLVQTLCLSLFPIARRPGPIRGAGLLLYLVGLTLALTGRLQLGKNWANLEDRKVQAGQSLVSNGVYAHIRHPIYIGDVLLVTGLELALNSWLFLLGLPLFAIVSRQAKAEEALLSESFSDYEAYRRRTRRFIPLVH